MLETVKTRPIQSSTHGCSVRTTWTASPGEIGFTGEGFSEDRPPQALARRSRMGQTTIHTISASAERRSGSAYIRGINGATSPIALVDTSAGSGEVLGRFLSTFAKSTAQAGAMNKKRLFSNQGHPARHPEGPPASTTRVYVASSLKGEKPFHWQKYIR